MAASLSRPDPSSPASVAEAGFSTSRRGFNQDEVRAFLTSVGAELGRLQERQRQLEAELREARAEPELTPELDDETVASLLGEETLRVLQTARESASQIKIRAEESAAKIVNDANDEANRLRQEAEVESARKRHDATSDAEAEVALAKQQGREMVNEARAYRERVLADLERRTNLARQQIEDLAHGRDRLLQVFERARLVAVDVTSELQSIDGPDELVNLSPTTGPLPLMVPTTQRPGTDAATSEPVGRPDVSTTDDPADVDVADDDTTAIIDVPTTDTDADANADDPADVGPLDTDHLETDHGDDDRVAADTDDDSPTDDGAATTDEAGADEAGGAAKPSRDANVVSLFGDRPQPAADADDDHDDEPVGDAGEASDEQGDEHGDDDKPAVDDIFERLRRSTPDTDDTDHADDTDEAEPAAAVDDVLAEHESTEADAHAGEVESTDGDADAADTAFSRRDEALTPLIVTAARKLKRALADEQNGALDLLRRNEPVGALGVLVPEADEHASQYVHAIADELLEAAVAGAGEAGKNDTKSLRTTLSKAALGGAEQIVRDDLVRPLRDRLERAITEGDGDNEDVTKRVRSVYREWKTQHIDDQLDDVFRFAYGGGLAAGVKPRTPLVWTIDPSEPTCPDCEDNSLGGEVPAGDEFPTGHTAAPAHAGCRCLAVPARR